MKVYKTHFYPKISKEEFPLKYENDQKSFNIKTQLDDEINKIPILREFVMLLHGNYTIIKEI